jgi:hypothetical protein
MFEPVIARPLPDRVLRELREHGPLSAAELAARLDLEDGRAVGSVLRALTSRRRVRWAGRARGAARWDVPRQCEVWLRRRDGSTWRKVFETRIAAEEALESARHEPWAGDAGGVNPLRTAARCAA